MPLTLKSADGQKVQVPDSCLRACNYLQNCVINGRNEIELDEFKSDVLRILVQYLNYYSKNDFPEIPEIIRANADIRTLLTSFDFSFATSINYEQAFNLINLANLLDLGHLHDLACFKIAAFLRNKTPEEVNKEFIIECQLTQEEARQLGLEPQ